MRWIWIDKFLEFRSGQFARAIKNLTLAEEHLHDHYPGYLASQSDLRSQEFRVHAAITRRARLGQGTGAGPRDQRRRRLDQRSDLSSLPLVEFPCIAPNAVW